MESFNFLNNISKSEHSAKERTNLDSFMQAINKHAIVSITDENGIILYVNKNFCTISQYSPEKLIGKTHNIINSGYHPVEFFESMWATIQQGQTWQGEICNRAKDGSCYWVLSTIQPFMDDNGNIVQYVSIRTDITQQKEEEILAKEANKTKGRFLANMSHEIRTPLTTIIGLSYLAEEEKNPIKLSAALQQIRKSGEYLLHTLDDVLDFAKIDENKLELRENQFSVIKATQQIMDMVKDNNVNRNSFSYNISPEVKNIVFGDEIKLKQILLNLVNNSAKFTKNGKININVSVNDIVNTEEDKQFVTFDVIDNGCGIEPHQISKIFSPFTQVDSTSSRSVEGSGLGLTISSHLVELMGGKLTVKSIPKIETIFSFTVPLALTKLEKTVSDNKDSLGTVSENSKGLLSGNVLLVEDNVVNRMIAEFGKLSVFG